jgi:hypothetical protein
VSEKTKVIFRKYKNGEILALFPELPGTNSPATCTCYQHIGQHGAADLQSSIRVTYPATEEEYKDLKNELTRIGYDLEIVSRCTYKMRLTRIKNTSR